MIGQRPVCLDCKHFFNEKGPFRCEAFPNGIPEEIAMGGNPHKRPYPGDNGIQFEKK